MGSKRTISAALAVPALTACIVATASSGAHRTNPSPTSTSIVIGGTFPLTGAAALFKTIPLAEKAYFEYVNDHGGVNGRKITFEILDDSYDPARTVQLTQKLVEHDHIFADFGSVGTAPNLAIREYLNLNSVPQVGIATGDSYWGLSYKRYPWTIGWEPDFPGEGKLYGEYIAANMPTARVGVLYQNDAFGKNYYAGLRDGMGATQTQIVASQSYDPTQTTVSQQILSLKAAGANALVIFAIPIQAILALATATKLGWKPSTTIVGSVSANRLFLLDAAAAGAKVNGVISTTYLDSTTNPRQARTPGVKLGTAILTQYAPTLLQNWKQGDGNVMYGLGDAWTFVYALQHAGRNPTRASLMRAYRSMNTKRNPFLYPGIRLQTSASDNFPIEQEILIKWQGGATGDWRPFGKLYNHLR
jgi:branched-chain amino acid transport system substrate-binding protein